MCWHGYVSTWTAAAFSNMLESHYGNHPQSLAAAFSNMLESHYGNHPQSLFSDPY